MLDGCPGAGSQLLQPLQADSQSRERRRYQHIIRVFPYTPATAVYRTHRHRAGTVSNTHTVTPSYTLRCNLSLSYIYQLLFADELCFKIYMHGISCSRLLPLLNNHICAVFLWIKNTNSQMLCLKYGLCASCSSAQNTTESLAIIFTKCFVAGPYLINIRIIIIIIPYILFEVPFKSPKVSR